jgi:uncharacterized membrane protein required for colicin V production
MGLVVDGIILLIIGGCVFTGYKRGLAKSLLKLLTSILAVIIAIVLYKPLVNFVTDNTLIDDNIQYSIEKVINSGDESKTEVSEDSSMPKPVIEFINDGLKNVDEAKEKTVSEVSKNAARLIVMIGSILVIFIITKIILQIITILFDLFSKIPVIKQCNELGGIIYGFLEGIVVVLILLALIAVLTPIAGNTAVVEMIEQSFIGKMLYDSNILLNLIF